jgi:protein subunit release factor A
LQAKLLKKIEELTLYVIELKKENEELNERINNIENIEVNQEKIENKIKNYQNIDEINTKITEIEKNNIELKLAIQVLEEKINKMLESNSNIIDCYEDIKLEQNIPNPFDGMTEIKCIIPEKYGKNVKLIISDGTGLREIKKYDLKSGLENIINVYASNYETGAYMYGIEVDGKIVKSKKMMIIK